VWLDGCCGACFAYGLAAGLGEGMNHRAFHIGNIMLVREWW